MAEAKNGTGHVLHAINPKMGVRILQRKGSLSNMSFINRSQSSAKKLYSAYASVLHFRLLMFSPVSRGAAQRFRIGLLIIQSLCNFISGSICGQTEQIKL